MIQLRWACIINCNPQLPHTVISTINYFFSSGVKTYRSNTAFVRYQGIQVLLSWDLGPISGLKRLEWFFYPIKPINIDSNIVQPEIELSCSVRWTDWGEPASRSSLDSCLQQLLHRLNSLLYWFGLESIGGWIMDEILFFSRYLQKEKKKKETPAASVSLQTIRSSMLLLLLNKNNPTDV